MTLRPLVMVPTLFGTEDTPAPLSDDMVLWRYMDQPRFLTLLMDKVLHFASRFEFKDVDPWEGIVPQRVIEAFAFRFGTGWERMIENFEYVVSRGCVLCWFESPFESTAMWDKYGSCGVAIRTSVRALRRSLNIEAERLRIARVQYGQHDRFDSGDSGYSALAPMLFKRREYIHEREVRAIVLPADESPSGPNLPVDVHSLIEEIFVSPHYPVWGIPALEKLIACRGLGVALQRSALGSKPPDTRIGRT